jgi:hypothetical protein
VEPSRFLSFALAARVGRLIGAEKGGGIADANERFGAILERLEILLGERLQERL